MVTGSPRIHSAANRGEGKHPRVGGSGHAASPERIELALTGLIFLLGGGVLLLSRPTPMRLTPTTLLSLLAIPGLIMAFFYGYVSRWQDQRIKDPRNLRIMAILFLFNALICRIFLILANTIHAGFPSIPLSISCRGPPTTSDRDNLNLFFDHFRKIHLFNEVNDLVEARIDEPPVIPDGADTDLGPLPEVIIADF